MTEEKVDLVEDYKSEYGLNIFLNFHRPCRFLSALRVRQAGATETMDEKGKIKKKYETYLTHLRSSRACLSLSIPQERGNDEDLKGGGVAT
ncbi:MAG: hypothetical protein U9Q94_08870 [Candidatus Bipolaricaulota bacterium]|nr:hypothetical protein [Candidatus Bipolaricaulota bacterium]